MVPAPALCAAAIVFVVTLPAGAQTWTVHTRAALKRRSLNSVWNEYER